MTCRNCQVSDLALVLSLGEQPLANAYLDEDALGQPEPRFPLELFICPGCGLAQLGHTVSPQLLFSDYPYFSSVSEAFVQHAKGVTTRIAAARGLDESSLVIEVGSNDGYLLQHYAKLGIPVLGIDPAANIAAVAEERGIPTMAEFFTADLAEGLRETGIRADVIHANNVIAHVPDLHGSVAGIARLLKANGIAVIETPYVRDLVERVEFDTIYHEHIFYYSLYSLSSVLRAHGLEVIDVEHLPVHGGTLRVTAALAASAISVSQRVASMREDEDTAGLATVGYFRTFAAEVGRVQSELMAFLEGLKAQGASIAAYGAAAKGTVLLNAFGIGTDMLEFVADRSPHKQGRWMPGVHVPVVSPDKLYARSPDACLLLAWNFADEIYEQQRLYREAGGKFIVPAPEVRYLD